MALDWTRNAIPTWEVISRFVDRLTAGITDPAAGSKPAGIIRIVPASDEDDIGAYKAEEGLHIVIGDPQPIDRDGATRSGQRVRLVFQVWIVTRGNQDRAGDYRIAAEKHFTLQDAVINALNDTPPDGVPVAQQNQVGIYLHWIPGGEEIRRRKKTAKDTFVSVQLYETHFVQRQQVGRE